jgi:hypothetical protein
MTSRLAAPQEMVLSLREPVPEFVRRKTAQGKRDPRRPRDAR